MEREDALLLIEDSSRRDHSLLVSRIMAVLSESHGEAGSDWELAGLLHDLDYDDIVDDREHHGVKAAEALSCLLDESILQAIKSHDHRSGYQPSSLLDHSLRFADAVSLLVTEPEDIMEGKPWIREIIEGYQMPEGLIMSELIKQFS
jgi:predicted hydrolase (HD superfamily)